MSGRREILVVDDSRIVQAMVGDVLEAEGYAVRRADDGRAALAEVAARRPDLVVLDVMMPEMDGYQVCEALRREEVYLPILMITAKGDLADLARGLDAGADDYIAKPFEPVELAARVRSLLRIGTLQQRLYCQKRELEAKNEELEALANQLDALNRELQLLSVTDGLTRAYNHRHFQERLRSELARAQRHGEPLSCAMIDIDHFKSVNDRHGHPVGDRVLVRLVEVLKEGIRGEDLVARYGGEEFGLLFPRTTASQARSLAERLRQRIAEERVPLPDGTGLGFTVSVGLADYRPGRGPEGPAELVQAADAALYRAKQDGRNRVLVA